MQLVGLLDGDDESSYPAVLLLMSPRCEIACARLTPWPLNSDVLIKTVGYMDVGDGERGEISRLTKFQERFLEI
jgi:hypothetical protein